MDNVWRHIEHVVDGLAGTKSETIQDCIRKLDVAFAFMDESDWPGRRLLSTGLAELRQIACVPPMDTGDL